MFVFIAQPEDAVLNALAQLFLWDLLQVDHDIFSVMFYIGASYAGLLCVCVCVCGSDEWERMTGCQHMLSFGWCSHPDESKRSGVFLKGTLSEHHVTSSCLHLVSHQSYQQYQLDRGSTCYSGDVILLHNEVIIRFTAQWRRLCLSFESSPLVRNLSSVWYR